MARRYDPDVVLQTLDLGLAELEHNVRMLRQEVKSLQGRSLEYKLEETQKNAGTDPSSH